MSDTWRWEALDAAGATLADAPGATAVFPTQGEAEAWLSESWEELADAGVAAVTLKHGDAPAYGPMPLDPA